MSVGRRSRNDVNRVRRLIFTRDYHTCVVRDTEWGIISPCSDILTVQHRVTRGMGSSNLHDTPRDLVTFCALHNYLETSHADFHTYCVRSGWSVRRSVAALWPLNRIPVRYGRSWFLLDGDGRFEITEEVANDLMEEMYG